MLDAKDGKVWIVDFHTSDLPGRGREYSEDMSFPHAKKLGQETTPTLEIKIWLLSRNGVVGLHEISMCNLQKSILDDT